MMSITVTLPFALTPTSCTPLMCFPPFSHPHPTYCTPIHLQVLVTTLLASWGMARHCPALVVVVWTVGWMLYLPTYGGEPSRTGRRRISVENCRWLTNHMASYFRFKMCQVPGAAEVDPKARCVHARHDIMSLLDCIGLMITWDEHGLSMRLCVPPTHPETMHSVLHDYICFYHSIF